MPRNTKSDLTRSGETRAGCVTLRITTSEKTCRAAARIARDRAGQELETVLAAFVGELAKADARPGPWSQNLVAVWLLTHAWPQPGEDELP